MLVHHGIETHGLGASNLEVCWHDFLIPDGTFSPLYPWLTIYCPLHAPTCLTLTKNSVRSEEQSYVCHKISIQSALSAAASMDRLLNSPTWHATQKKSTEFHVLWRWDISWKTSVI